MVAICCGSMPKVVNLKAIHNLVLTLFVLMPLWLNAKGSKSESNSQLRAYANNVVRGCGSMPKVVNLKAIHNTSTTSTELPEVVAQCQR